MRARFVTGLVALGVVAAGCGGGDADEPVVTSSVAATTTTPAPATTTTITAAAASTTSAPAGPQRVFVVGDSTLLAVEWYDQFAAFGGFDLVFDAKSCRAVGARSCAVPPPAPPNVVETIDALEGDIDAVVVMSGYDEWWTSFPASFDAAVAAARDKGAARIVWLSYVESPDYVGLQPTPLTEVLQRHNATLREKAATGAYPDVVIADWNTYVRAHPDWLEDDGVHLTIAGAAGVADYISRQLAFLDGRACPAPTTPDGPLADPCPDPATIEPIADVLALHR